MGWPRCWRGRWGCTGGRAEGTIYHRLDQTLSDEYTVIYSVNWLSTDPEGCARVGEADFCILHERAGLLIVEVKGDKI